MLANRDKSEMSCRPTLKLLQQNPQVVPPCLSVIEATELVVSDQIDSLLLRLSRLRGRREHLDWRGITGCTDCPIDTRSSRARQVFTRSIKCVTRFSWSP